MQAVVSNPKFLYSAFYTFSNENLLKYFSDRGLNYKVEYDEKVYTMSDKADEVIEILKKDLDKSKVKVIYGAKVIDLIVEEDVVKGVVIEGGKSIFGEKVIVTTGGKSVPNTGSDGSM